MRVVAGSAKGRVITAPSGKSTRPTSDRVREATFNALGSLGVLEDAVVLDAFAGSGALGIEALSRGVQHVTFVDRDSKAIGVVRANLEALKFGELATIVHREVEKYLSNDPGHFDLAFFDPPYATSDDKWQQMLTSLDATTVVMEADREVEVPEGFTLHRRGRYGDTVVTIVGRKERQQ